MDRQSTGDKQNSFTQFFNNLFVSRRSKLLLFASVIIVNVIASTHFNNEGTIFWKIFNNILGTNGLTWIGEYYEFHNYLEVIILSLSYPIVYLGCMFVGILSKKPKVSKIFFLIYSLLTVLNIAGSTLIET